MATAQDVITRVRNLINDEASGFVSTVRWSDAEIMRWITDGQREIVKLKPEANPVTDYFATTANTPRQQLDPAVAYRLIRVEANGIGTVDGALAPLVVRDLTGGQTETASSTFSFTYAPAYTIVDGDDAVVLIALALHGTSVLDSEPASVSYGNVAGTWLYDHEPPSSGTGHTHMALVMVPLQTELPDDDVVRIVWSGVGIEGLVDWVAATVTGVNVVSNDFGTDSNIIIGGTQSGEMNMPAGSALFCFGVHHNASGVSPAYENNSAEEFTMIAAPDMEVFHLNTALAGGYRQTVDAIPTELVNVVGAVTFQPGMIVVLEPN